MKKSTNEAEKKKSQKKRTLDKMQYFFQVLPQD